MVKDLRRDPIFKQTPFPFQVKGPPTQDLLHKYKEMLNHIIIFRTVLMVHLGGALYIFFTYLDRIAYPPQASFFLKIRIAAVLLCSMLCALFFFKFMRKHSIWIADLVSLVFIGGICLMIYETGGASSSYYAGLNLVLLATTVITAVHFWHGAMIALLTMLFYALTCLVNHAGWDIPKFLIGSWFVNSTAFFVILMTWLYSSQNFLTFVQNEKLRESEQKLKILYGLADEKSKIDDLTKIYNRRYFFEVLADKIKTCKAQNSFFFLIILDIDHFKKINDTYGHVFGDQVISSVAKVVRDMMRLNSYIGRYGGDEFMLIIDKATQEEFLTRLQNIRQAIRGLQLFCDDKPVSLSASFGAARWELGMTDERRLIELADTALLEVKRTQRGEIKLAN